MHNNLSYFNINLLFAEVAGDVKATDELQQQLMRSGDKRQACRELDANQRRSAAKDKAMRQQQRSAPQTARDIDDGGVARQAAAWRWRQRRRLSGGVAQQQATTT
ncbi:hypothetical protein Scep_021930 [Stephania cephalantha]|uniref:Uncharacterized protein n=1 Tax=Stephania cephalantha TaxID=152367 RepID=A0AAP0F5F7_9MAGN